MKELNTSRVSREKRGHVLMIGLDRVAKRNAFDLDLLNELSLAYGEFEADTEARVAVVFGHGEHFTAGLDLVNASAKWTSASEKYGVLLWGKNLTDEEYWAFANSTATVTKQIPNAPRTYGVSFSAKF